jgi:acyl phosphate:glycerol-3-phosphate acyltransferase
MILLAALVGYLIGATPTAAWIARWMKGIDLRQVGSGNPGANNALQTGGPSLAATVLMVEMAKGAGAVLVGGQVGGEYEALAAGLGAIAGNLYNLYYRFRGGKGLGITAGVLLAAWPTVFIPSILVIVLGAKITRSSGAAAIIAIVALNLMALVWIGFGLPMAWGLSRDTTLLILASGAGIMIWPKHWGIARFRSSSPA